MFLADLSAKVENVQKESIQKTEPEKVKETMKSETKPQENKTVSSNTKELIKAALLNSNLRKQRQGIMFSIIYSCDYIW
jgi:23S rRNA maturation-related 3'-5' exoribonuclease YhaM